MEMRSTLQAPTVLTISSNRGTPPPIELDDLWKVRLSEPEVANLAGLEGEDHKAIRHSLHLVETAVPIGPVMQRQHRERGVECPGSEWQCFSRSLDYPADAAFDLCWIMCHDGSTATRDPPAGLISASASSHVDHRFGIAECIQNHGGDSRIRMPGRRVAPSDLVVKNVRHARWFHA